uniref:Uncharacterized protein n=1 Tax=Romanomermis culicivorax TaxID=13658 RepID=A0A915IAF6_ROMCU
MEGKSKEISPNQKERKKNNEKLKNQAYNKEERTCFLAQILAICALMSINCPSPEFDAKFSSPNDLTAALSSCKIESLSAVDCNKFSSRSFRYKKY